MLDPLKSQERLEFNQGDIGFARGIQIMEPASLGARSRFGVASFPMEKTMEKYSVLYMYIYLYIHYMYPPETYLL